jgi:hypothetical protein
MDVVMGAATGEGTAGSTRRVTRDVAPAALPDLLAHPVRATVAFVDADGIELLPARAGAGAEPFRFGVVADSAPDLDGREVVLVIDDGQYWFELRGISVRGVARRIAAPPPSDGAGATWYAIEARRILAWDYATIREE